MITKPAKGDDGDIPVTSERLRVKKTNKIVLKLWEVGLVAREKRRDVVVYAISNACRDLILKVSHSRPRLIDEMADMCRKEKYCQIWGT